MEISDARKLKGLEEENRKLKKLEAPGGVDPGCVDAATKAPNSPRMRSCPGRRNSGPSSGTTLRPASRCRTVLSKASTAGCATSASNEHLFANLNEARQIIEEWRIDYNTNRPHTSLNGLTPTEFATRINMGQTPNRLSS